MMREDTAVYFARPVEHLGLDFLRYRFAFIGSNSAHWGGSEELWAAAAIELAEAGHAVTVFKANVDWTQPRIRRLRALSCRIRDMVRIPFLPRKVSSFISKLIYPVITVQQIARVWLGLRLFGPDLVIISQGGNYDGLLVADICRRMELPFVLISQKAADIYWTPDSRLPRLRAVYAAAAECFFVSEANIRLTEEQLGFALPHASVVRNPFLVPWEERSDWPQESDGLRLACVGRLYPAEKGQDLLLRVLGRDKWRERPLSVAFFGSGPHRDALERMAKFHNLTSVRFAGHVENVAAIWDDHHALVLPSRSEGLPLVLVEAMLSGRLGIVTDVAGHREVIEDGVTGFLAATASEDAIDEALERAWQRRAEWRALGAAASTQIRTFVPPNPGAAMATTLLRVLERAAVDASVDDVVSSVAEELAAP